MLEKDINSKIVKSLDFAHKISDESKGKKPFDIFGVYKGKGIYIETKYLSKPQSFNFNRLEDHQIASLLDIYNSDKGQGNLIAVFLVAVNFGHADVRVFYYLNMPQINKRKLSKDNILKKEFEASTNYVKIKKGLIDFNKIINEVT